MTTYQPSKPISDAQRIAVLSVLTEACVLILRAPASSMSSAIRFMAPAYQKALDDLVVSDASEYEQGEERAEIKVYDGLYDNKPTLILTAAYIDGNRYVNWKTWRCLITLDGMGGYSYKVDMFRSS